MKVKLALFLLISASLTLSAQTSWKAPKNADGVTNITKDKSASIARGQKIYVAQCLMCHGKKGNGKGPAGLYLEPKPADFTSQTVQAQTDGALFWKLTHGNSPMAAYKDLLTEKERWDLINYIRT